MKKVLLSLCVIFMLTPAAIAQPVLTDANTQITVGDMFDVRFTNYVSPGNAGPNQTWDLSGLTTNFSKNILVAASSTTPNASSFPASNLAFNELNGTYVYFNATSSMLQLMGRDFGSGSMYVLTDPEDLLQFPMSYYDTFTDTYAGTVTSGDPQNGTTTITYDAYGTVILPTGTYTNVARLHRVSEYVNTSAGVPDSFVVDEYIWYLPGNHYPLAKLSSWDWIGVGPSYYGEYLNNPVTNINENTSLLKDVSIYPNPACKEININLTKTGFQNIEIYITDLSGRICKSVFINSKENIYHTIPISDLESGTYFIHFKTKEDILVQKMIKI